MDKSHRKSARHKTIGFQIHNPPEEWTAFAEQLEAGSDELGFMVLGSDQEN